MIFQFIQYFGTIICDRLHGIMKLYIQYNIILINSKSDFCASFQNYLPMLHKKKSSLQNMMSYGVVLWLQNYKD